MNQSRSLRVAPNVVSRIEAKVVDCPDDIAVCFEEQTLTYRELWQRSAGLAAQLREHSVGPDERVAVYMHPSPEAIIAIIGILRSGGSYLPIAPDIPPALIDHILAESKVHFVLSDLATEHVGNICLFAPQAWRQNALDHWDVGITSLQQLAYVIYTSGSTGKPKGVMVDHANLENSMAARREYYGEAPYRALLLPSVAFDSSVAVIFPVLCQGGTLIIPSQRERRDPMALLNLIERHSVTEVLALPAIYQTMLAIQGAADKISRLERVILAGDLLPSALVNEHFQACPATKLYNEYGPTEVTVWSTVYRCSPADGAAPVSIGSAIPGTSVYILDAQTFTPSDPGTEGEIFVGGASVTRGYLSSSTQTALNFLPDPFSTVPGARLYRTGDRGQMSAKGIIGFIGRNDHQVKVRGYRVELGQIENELSGHPGIKAAVVVLRRNSPWKGQLVAFFELRNAQIGIGELKTFLVQKLPDYMLPFAYIQLTSLPLTSNGKPDRSQMAHCAIEQMFPESEYVAPRTPLEEQLCAAWCEVLHISKVSVFDHYMDFGADSIAAMQFTAAAQKLGISLSPVDIFACGTVAALAGTIAEQQQSNAPQPKPALPMSEGPFYWRLS